MEEPDIELLGQVLGQFVVVHHLLLELGDVVDDGGDLVGVHVALHHDLLADQVVRLLVVLLKLRTHPPVGY